jgi:hypothetical protein
LLDIALLSAQEIKGETFAVARRKFIPAQAPTSRHPQIFKHLPTFLAAASIISRIVLVPRGVSGILSTLRC